jgi:hypothetical protein
VRYAANQHRGGPWAFADQPAAWPEPALTALADVVRALPPGETGLGAGLLEPATAAALEAGLG